MNKQQLVDKMALATGLSKADCARALSAFTDTVINTVADGGKVELVGFGSFSQTERSARTGRNPQTGATINIAAAKLPKFKAGKAFKDKVNK
ncbi:MAG: HU family DNA-binding protein [Gammaproteobacteria bacterium]|nr:HU family DNA-binding protein [Gammaproteobacteria bacterium]